MLCTIALSVPTFKNTLNLKYKLLKIIYKNNYSFCVTNFCWKFQSLKDI
ncbi:hypothetical protein J490_0651 [Acinetobacter baumannii 942194]|nr:hypothetical protein J490_0651 [Acinetobacter baumannii 942194]